MIFPTSAGKRLRKTPMTACTRLAIGIPMKAAIRTAMFDSAPFEKGGRYKYSVKLQAKDGYTFDSNLTNTENVTLNGASLPFGSWGHGDG